MADMTASALAPFLRLISAAVTVPMCATISARCLWGYAQVAVSIAAGACASSQGCCGRNCSGLPVLIQCHRHTTKPMRRRTMLGLQ